MAKRWKKQPREIGLRAVGAGPRISDYHDGSAVYATVCPLGGSWGKPIRGWYFVSSIGVLYENTCDDPAPDEATAKKQAEAWVKEALKQEPQ